MRQNPHVRICGGPGSATTLVYPTCARHGAQRPVGIQSHPAKVGRQPEPSDAWAWGDPRARSVHREPVGRGIEPRNALFVRADVVRWTEGYLAASQRPWRRRPRRGRSAWHACGWVSREPGRPRRLHRKDRRGAGTGSPSPRPWTQHLASDGAKPQVLGWYRRAKATKRGGMDGEESACLIVPPKRGN